MRETPNTRKGTDIIANPMMNAAMPPESESDLLRTPLDPKYAARRKGIMGKDPMVSMSLRRVSAAKAEDIRCEGGGMK